MHLADVQRRSCRRSSPVRSLHTAKSISKAHALTVDSVYSIIVLPTIPSVRMSPIYTYVYHTQAHTYTCTHIYVVSTTPQ